MIDLFPQRAPPTAGAAVVFFASSYLSPVEVYGFNGYQCRSGYENFESSFQITPPIENKPPPGAFVALWRSPAQALQQCPNARYLYQVHTSENMIEFSHNVWSLGGINVSQILGHYSLTGHEADEDIPWNLPFRENEFYDEQWWWGRRMTAFHPRMWNRAEPRISAELFMERLSDEARRAIGWTGHFPLPNRVWRPLSPVRPVARPLDSSMTDIDDADMISLSDDESELDFEPPMKKPHYSPPVNDTSAGPSRSNPSDSSGSTSGSRTGSPPATAEASRADGRVPNVYTDSEYWEEEFSLFSESDRLAMERVVELGQMDPSRCLALLAHIIMLMARGVPRRDSTLQRRWVPPVATEAVYGTPAPITANNSCSMLRKRLRLIREHPETLSTTIQHSLQIPDIYNLSARYGTEFALIRSDFPASTALELGYLPAPAFDGLRQLKPDWSIYNHHHGLTPKHYRPAYLTATRDTDRGLNRNRNPDGATYVYVAQLSANSIPVGTTLGINEPDDYAVARHLSTHLIHGWLNLTTGRYIRNRAFVSLGSHASTSAPQPQLAGFPLSSRSWALERYKSYAQACIYIDAHAKPSQRPSKGAIADAISSCTRNVQLEVLRRHGQSFLDRLPCVALERLAVYMEIGSDGTAESVSVVFPYQSVRIFKEATAGNSRWQGIDLELAYQKAIVPLSEMGDLEIKCSSNGWHDSWTLTGLKLRGKCITPRVPVEYRHYENMNANFQNTEGVDAIVWQKRLLASRWSDCPNCQVLYPLAQDNQD
ncbi:putative enterotoxin [Ophiocordyceps camponoti-floridani]|uniref:Putative enterotoxin n=1 Tax=Ophiocordyceps camponoti-floridani TaxID=2030778 RepID=A0A8H4Q7M1_9HYPO|nr:putative enterotoxin [Ophiocordyceps camponoti-floridani]